MVYDCFSFYNELDLLEIRLNVLKDVVDRFVLVEATQTHTGKSKPLYYEENKTRFAAFADKIIHVVVDDFPAADVADSERRLSWMRENFQRNAVVRGLVDAHDDDLVMVSDVDEIPSPYAVQTACAKKGVIVCEQLLCNYYLNFVSYTTPIWPGTKIVRYKDFCESETYSKMGVSEYVDERVNVGPTATRLRYLDPTSRIHRAGWHFSYLGGAKAIVAKIDAIAVEYRDGNNTREEWVAKTIEQGLDVCGCGRRFFAVPLDARFPDWIRNNTERFADLIVWPDDGYYRRTRRDRFVCLVRGWIRRNGAKLIPRFCKQFLYDRVYCKIVKDPIVV